MSMAAAIETVEADADVLVRHHGCPAERNLRMTKIAFCKVISERRTANICGTTVVIAVALWRYLVSRNGY